MGGVLTDGSVENWRWFPWRITIQGFLVQKKKKTEKMQLSFTDMFVAKASGYGG